MVQVLGKHLLLLGRGLAYSKEDKGVHTHVWRMRIVCTHVWRISESVHTHV